MFLLMLRTDGTCNPRRNFQCKHLYHCIPKNQVKDGIEHCLDRTDEGLLIIVPYTTVNVLLGVGVVVVLVVIIIIIIIIFKLVPSVV